MDPDSLSPIGFVQRPHGLKGELKLRFNQPLKEIPEVIFIDRVPYFPANINMTGEYEAIGQFEDITSREAAEKLSGMEMSAEMSEEVSEEVAFDIQQLNGYTAVDEARGELGPIKEVVEMPMQVLLHVIYKDNEVMIPLNDDSLLNIDHDERKVHLVIPEGLVDIYA